MKNITIILLSVFITHTLVAQNQSKVGCFDRLQKAFEKRGSYSVADDIHRNVILSFFTDEGQECLSGKVRVEHGAITSIFIQYNEGDYELLEKKFNNAQKAAPRVTNGISEMIYISDGQRLRVIFIDKLKPKPREYKSADLPSDL